MATYNLNTTFCDESDVFAAAGYTYTSADTPTDSQVYLFAQWAAGQIVLVTDRAGSRYTPPASAISDEFFRRTLIEANAVGAAYRARAIQAAGGDPHIIQLRDQLREMWIRYVGGTAANGEEVEGLIAELVEAAAAVPAIRTDETEGYTQFPSTTATAPTLGRTFTDSDVD